MLLTEAKAYIGQVCTIRYRDRSGSDLVAVSKVYDATFVPLYGGYLVTDADDIRLDRICGVSLVSSDIDTETIRTTIGSGVLEQAAA